MVAYSCEQGARLSSPRPHQGLLACLSLAGNPHTLLGQSMSTLRVPILSHVGDPASAVCSTSICGAVACIPTRPCSNSLLSKETDTLADKATGVSRESPVHSPIQCVRQRNCSLVAHRPSLAVLNQSTQASLGSLFHLLTSLPVGLSLAKAWIVPHHLVCLAESVFSRTQLQVRGVPQEPVGAFRRRLLDGNPRGC